MATEYGKYLKKLRIDESEKLADMAKRLGISTSYLSFIENGTREIPPDFSYRVWKEYKLSEDKTKALVAAETATPKKTVTIDLAPKQGKELHISTAVLFGQCISKLSTPQVQQLDNLLHKFIAESQIDGVIGDFS